MCAPLALDRGRWRALTWPIISPNRASRLPSMPEMPVSTHSDSNGTTGPTQVTPSLLRDWPLPDHGENKYSRGAVLIIGGARTTPGATILAGIAALRAGAGKMTLAVAESVAAQVGVEFPEW